MIVKADGQALALVQAFYFVVYFRFFWDQAWKILMDTFLTGLFKSVFYVEIKGVTVKSHFKAS